MKNYIAFSNEFRKSQISKESIKNLYDLMYELKDLDNRSKEENLILSNIYSLLGFHKSAYDIFEPIADKCDRKDCAKLYKMKEKAESHKDIFLIKNIADLEKKQEQVNLSLSDLTALNNDINSFSLKEKNVVIFNKPLKGNKIIIEIFNGSTKDCLPQLNKYLNWLANCKKELVHFYNNEEDFEDIANEQWYDTLEIYKAKITIDKSNSIFSFITCGDDFWQDHLLDIEIRDKEILSMAYDG